MNNHYIPQFLLKHFCENGTIQYCDIENRKVEVRNTRSVFSKKGYYPDELEHDLCNKIESQFSKLLNDKLAISRYGSEQFEDLLEEKDVDVIEIKRKSIL